MNSNFPDALARLIAASTRYTIAEQAHADQGDYNWDYAGWELNLAMEEFEDELNKLIDSRINEVLSKMSEPQA